MSTVGSSQEVTRQSRPWGLVSLAVIVVALLTLSFRSASIPLLDPDEARFARTSVEMVRSGDLVVPHFEGRPRLVKPPLVHWIQAALFSLTGATEVAARLHAVLATLGTILLVGWVARHRFGSQATACAMAVTATMPLVVALGRLGTLDALLAVHVFAPVALDLVEPEARPPTRAFAVGLLLGLGFLTKGPIGTFLPLLVMLAGRTAAGRELLPTAAQAVAAVSGWAVTVLPWGLAFLDRVGSGAVFSLLRSEALDRYATGTDHVKPAWFYLPVLLLGLLPWSGILIRALVRLVANWRDPGAVTARYAASGIVVGVVFLSFGQGKMANYLLPLAPLAALLVTWEVGEWLRDPGRQNGPAWMAASLVGCFSLLVVAGFRLEGPPRQVAWVSAAIFALGGLFASLAVHRARPLRVFTVAAATAAAFQLVLVGGLLPSLARTRTSAYLILQVPRLEGPGPVLMVDMKVPSLTFYLDRIPEEVSRDDLSARLARGDAPLLVFDERDLPHAPPAARARLREIGRQGKYRVFEEREGVAPAP